MTSKVIVFVWTGNSIDIVCPGLTLLFVLLLKLSLKRLPHTCAAPS